MVDIPKGSLFLGDKINPADHKRANDFVLYEAASLTTHGVIVGMTGSGKTGLGIVLLEECLLQGIPALIIDPKGDMGNLLLAFPDQKPESFRPYVLESDAKKEGRTLDEHAAVVAKQWADGQAAWDMAADRIRTLHDAANFTIYTPGSNTGIPLNIVGDMRRPGSDVDDEVLQDEIDGLVSSLLNLVDIESDPLSGREHILLSNLVANAWRNNADLDLAALVAQVQQPPMRKLGVIDLDTFFPEKDRLGLAMRLNGLIASPAFASWARGVPLDIDSLLYTGGKPNAAIIEIAHLSDQERQFVVTLVLSKLVTWMRQQSGTPDLRVIVYMDEVFGFVPPTATPPAKKPILTIFKQARAFGIGMVLATQNPVDIDYKAIANAGTWMIGRLQTERDKARLMEGLKDAAGATDMDTIDSTISGLAKREFVLHSAKANKPVTFTSRWALSYLPGPLSREQITALMADSPLRHQSAARPVDTAGAPARDSEPAAAAPAPALADDESSLAPTIADGVPVYYLDPAAAWASQVGARSGSKRLVAAVVARVNLLFDDEKADVREQQEWEAVFYPLDGALDAANARHVDYDDRDFRSTPPDGAVYVLPDAELKSKTYFAKAKAELQDHLYRTMTVEVFKNSELKLFSRVGESKEDFETRCGQAADDLADKDADKLRKTMADKIDRIKDAIDKAEDKVREVHSDKKKRGLDAVVSAAGGILGSFLGGRKSTKSVLGTVTRTMGKERMREQAGERLETAKNRLEGQHEELADLEQELTDKLQAIQDEWDRKAAQVESLSIELEKTDITVDEIAVVWVPTE
jgi:hypothetical protein